MDRSFTQLHRQRGLVFVTCLVLVHCGGARDENDDASESATSENASVISGAQPTTGQGNGTGLGSPSMIAVPSARDPDDIATPSPSAEEIADDSEATPTPAAAPLQLTLSGPVAFQGQTIAIEATVSGASTAALTWTQTGGTPVPLTTHGMSASFIAPNVTADTLFTFQVNATADGRTVMATAIAKVLGPFSFLGADATTGPLWATSGYGRAGYWIPRGAAAPGASGAQAAYPMIGQPGNDDLYRFPAGVSLAWDKNAYHWIWAAPSSAATKSMRLPIGTTGIESCLWNPATLELDVLQDNATRQPRVLRLYVTDHENNRQLDVYIKDKLSNIVLNVFHATDSDTRWRGAGASGFWLSYTIYNDVTVRIEALQGNAILQGIAFDSVVQGNNHAPKADDAEISSSKAVVALHVNASDADGDTLLYQWTQVSGDAVTLSRADQSNPSFIPTAPGTYVFQVSVTDWALATASANVTVTVVPKPTPPTFLGADALTGGDWATAGYGTSGHFIPGAKVGVQGSTGAYPVPGAPGNFDLFSLPSGVTLDWDGTTHVWIWNDASTLAQKSLARPAGGAPIESCIWNENRLTVRINAGGTAMRTVRLYVTDHENNRELEINLKDGDTGQTLHTFRALASDPQWRNGKGYWLNYRVQSDITIEITALQGNAILQGILWD